MNKNPSRLAYALAIVSSAALWVATAAISGKAEPWDSTVYWTVSYPLAIVLAWVLGYAFPQRPWRWALVVMFTQAAVMIAAGSDVGLLPLGLILLAVLSIPAVVLALLGFGIALRGEGA